MGYKSALLTFILLAIRRVMQYTPSKEDPCKEAETRFKLKTDTAPFSILFTYPDALVPYWKKLWKHPMLPVNSSIIPGIIKLVGYVI